MYYPEANPLVPIDSVADESNCPASKSVSISLKPSAKQAKFDWRGAIAELRSV
jgi:hypothetical protein